MRTRIVCLAAAAVMAAAPALAQDKYPSRPVDMIVPWGPGGGADAMSRQAARLLEPILGVAVPVTNISGASGNAGLTRVATNPADGYTAGVLIAITVSSWATGLGTTRPKDFQVVGFMQNSPSMLFVPKDSPFKTAKELLDHAKANPDKLRVATSGYGSQDDITLRYLASQGYPMKNVPFAKPAERYASTVGAHTDAIYEEPGDVAQFVKAGSLRPLLMFEDARHPSFPDVMTSKELGMSISDMPNFRTIVVKAGTPPEVVETLRGALAKVLQSDEWKAFCADTYTCVDKVYTAEESQAAVQKMYDTVARYLQQFPQVKQQAAN
ncbi:tripartite tricarboxylate transporter substrate binding protein [Azospirillum sp. ST 5-10]|uniref:tripartite tricarboxylate transporter substrate binding protein n=1 Tax=unclassified Azospirillum TaxID=2630922 RepID=UPI003F4A6D7E